MVFNTTLLTDNTLEKQHPLQNLPTAENNFLQTNSIAYFKSVKTLQQLVNDRILVTPIPIKLQTLLEKKMLVNNFTECLGWYNDWADLNGYPYIDDSTIKDDAINELKHWYNDMPNKIKLLSKQI